MANKVYSQRINDIKDYIDGLKESFLISPEILDYFTQSNECDFSHLQKQIIESPEDEDLKDLMEGEFSDVFIGLFLRLPLVQAFQYLSHNAITIDVPDEYYLEDNEQIYEEFKTIKRVVRVEVFNRLCKCYPNKRTLFKNAILDLDGDSMKKMLDDEEIELKWFRNWMGLSLYCSSVWADARKMELPIKDGQLFVGDCSDIVNINQEEDQPYQSEMVESNYEHTITPTRGFSDAKLTLKNYWFNHSRYRHNDRQVIDDYINKPCFSKFVSECWAEFEEDERQQAVETAADDMENMDNKPVVEEIQSQSTQNTYIAEEDKIFNFSPNDNAINLFPEGETAFDGSKGLADYAINNKEKIERFVHLMVKKFHYIPDDKKQAKAFVRTITGIQFDGGKTKPKLLSDEAVNAILFMAQRGILTGKINQALQKFDFEEGVTFEHEGNWHSTYAKRADIQFKKLVEETFCNYELYKPEKK